MATVTHGNDFAADRYKYDLRYTISKGWAQLDTRQDAPYYGTWVNPITLELFSFCEGDTSHTKCDDEEDFISAVTTCVDWHKENEYFIGIDGMESDPVIAAFTRMGLAEFLHQQ